MKITPADSRNIRLVQITDTHVDAADGENFEGMDSTAALERVIARINALAPAPDAVLATGDLAHHAGEAVYNKLLQRLSSFKAPVFCLPGNHDDPVLMRKILNRGAVSTKKILNMGPWKIVLLNTWMPDNHSGRLPEEELAFLQQAIMGREDKNILVCMHHPPVKTGSPWMDAMMLENPEPLFNILDGGGHVRGIVWGHIHQEFRQLRGETLLLGTPSTCVQFKPNTREFTKDVLPPAFRTLTLTPEGAIESHIVWVQ